MKNNTYEIELKLAIEVMELKHSEQGAILNEKFTQMIGQVSLGDLIIRSLREISNSKSLQKEAKGVVLNLALDELSSCVIKWVEKKPMRKIIFNVLILGISKSEINFGIQLRSVLKSAFAAIISYKRNVK